MLFCPLLEKSELPADFAALLPAKVAADINALLANKSLDCAQKMEKIDELMKTVPDEVTEKLPMPPHLAQLPAEVQAQIKKLGLEMKYKSVEEKKEAFKAFAGTLPAEQRAIICKEKPSCGK
ncbi:hypothetical protein niasHT_036475 [Heterodera trifolii]|uniref:Uncharacterized protein n=1 Tax=Heterodera trifolii TaxID=157864 RepID=A0ABD2IVC8_9BILA